MSDGTKQETITIKKSFDNIVNTETKAVAYSKMWDGNNFSNSFIIPKSATTDIPNDDIVMTKDNIYTYNFDYQPAIKETEPIANSQKIYYTITDSTLSFSTAGTHQYEVTCAIKDSAGKDVTSNYNITYDYSWLMIHQVAINVFDITNPSAKTLTYNGQNQALVNAGLCQYGTLEYTIDGAANSGESNWTAYNGNNWKTTNGTNNTGWSKDIPQGIYAGNYTVYWRVRGDQNHYDYTNWPNDKVSVTINRAPQNITFDSYNVTFCLGYISRNFNVTGRYENAPLSVSTNSIVNASINGTRVTVSSIGKRGNGIVTVSAAQTANYLAGSKDFSARICNHDYEYSHDEPRAKCTSNGIAHYYCTYCDDESTEYIAPLGHSMASSTKGATCYSTGNIHYFCTRSGCSYSYDVPIPETGHNNNSPWEPGGNCMVQFCTWCHLRIGNKTHNYSGGVCKNCGAADPKNNYN